MEENRFSYLPVYNSNSPTQERTEVEGVVALYYLQLGRGLSTKHLCRKEEHREVCLGSSPNTNLGEVEDQSTIRTRAWLDTECCKNLSSKCRDSERRTHS